MQLGFACLLGLDIKDYFCIKSEETDREISN